MYRDTCKKLVEAEERSKMLKNLVKLKIGLNEDEKFLHNSDKKFKVLGKNEHIVGKKHLELSQILLKYKIKDNNLFSVKLRKKRSWLRGKIETSLGSRSKECRRLIEEVKEYGMCHRKVVRRKNTKKVEHLFKKFGRGSKSGWDELSKEVKEFMGNPRVLMTRR